MSRETDRYREQIASELLDAAGGLGLEAGEEAYLHADGVSDPGRYSLGMIADDVELIAQRARQVEARVEVIYSFVRGLADVLKLEPEVDLNARSMGPGGYAVEHAVVDLQALERQAKAVMHNVEALKREREMGAMAVGFLGVLIGSTPGNNSK
ncbi:MAG: hypothetical protein ABH864_01985 [archaeon]